jgi:hypothetical protein
MLRDVLPRAGDQIRQPKITGQSAQAPLDCCCGCAASQEEAQQTELGPPPNIKRPKQKPESIVERPGKRARRRNGRICAAARGPGIRNGRQGWELGVH